MDVMTFEINEQEVSGWVLANRDFVTIHSWYNMHDYVHVEIQSHIYNKIYPAKMWMHSRPIVFGDERIAQMRLFIIDKYFYLSVFTLHHMLIEYMFPPIPVGLTGAINTIAQLAYSVEQDYKKLMLDIEKGDPR